MQCEAIIVISLLAGIRSVTDIWQERAEERTGVVQQRVQEGLLAVDNQEAAKRKKQQKDLSARMEELQFEIGVNLRPLMTALNIERPQETLKVSESMELFKIRDPMDEMVEYKMGSIRQQFSSRVIVIGTLTNSFTK